MVLCGAVGAVGVLGVLGARRWVRGAGCLLVRVFHPVDTVQVAEACVHVLAIHFIIRAAIGTPRRFLCICSGGRVDVEAFWQGCEHAARFTGFHVENLGAHTNQSLPLIATEIEDPQLCIRLEQ